MPGFSWRIRLKTFCQPMDFGPGWVLPSLLLISLLFAGCQTTDVVTKSTYDPQLPIPDAKEFHRSAKILLKRCLVEFGEENWTGLSTESNKLEHLSLRWASVDLAATGQSAAKDLTSACRTVQLAATDRNSTKAAAGLSQAADAITRLKPDDRVSKTPGPATPPKK